MKLDYEYIKEYIESFGYKLISSEYIKSNIRLDMMCDKGHKCSISWDNFKYGRRCKECASKIKADKFKLNYQDVKDYIEKFGCKLLSDDYINNSKKLRIQCSCGNIYEMTFKHFKQYEKYRKCIKCRNNKSKKFSYKYVKEFIEKEGYKLISETYVNANEKLLIQCDKNHLYHATFRGFRFGRRCTRCSKSYKPNISEVKSYLKTFGYECLDDEYLNNAQRLNIICDKGHRTTIAFRDFKDGCRCNVCRMSKGERVIEKYLMENKIKYEYNKEYFSDLTGIGGNPLRPDFILPEHKIWIEYDGEFHHRKMYDTDGHEKTKIHDKLKDEYAKKHGWKLIRIPYWEFDNIEKILNKQLI